MSFHDFCKMEPEEFKKLYRIKTMHTDMLEALAIELVNQSHRPVLAIVTNAEDTATIARMTRERHDCLRPHIEAVKDECQRRQALFKQFQEELKNQPTTP